MSEEKRGGAGGDGTVKKQVKIIQIATAMTSCLVKGTLEGQNNVQIIMNCYGLDEDGTLWELEQKRWKKLTESPEKDI